MLLGCSKSFLQIDITLYEGCKKVMLCTQRTKSCTTKQMIETAERDKDTSELNNVRNQQSLTI